jgi:hypothetical protein
LLDAEEQIMRSGFFRLWIVISALWFVGWGLKVGVDRWWNPACFKVFSVSTPEGAKPDDKALAKNIQSKLSSNIYCADKIDSELLTLEDLAKRQIVTQVATEYLTPSGWSGDAFAAIDVFGEFGTLPIRISDIRDSTLRLVQQSRLSALYPLLPIIFGVPVFLLFVGIAIAWVADGFKGKRL